MKKNISVSDDILLYALRYSLTRQTSAPSVVMDSIIHNIDNISEENMEKMIKEIESSADIGYSLYEETWNGLVNDLKFELKVRKLKRK